MATPFSDDKSQLQQYDIHRIEQLPLLETQDQIPNSIRLKIVLVGDGGVGKTSFVRRFKEGVYSRVYKATIGVETSVIVVKTNFGQTLVLEIWDTAGQEMNSGLSDVFYIDAHAFLLFFDVTSRITHQNLKFWIKKACDMNYNRPHMPIIVCANKCDLGHERKIHPNMTRKNLHRVTDCFDISVHANFGLEKPLLTAVRHIFNMPELTFVTNVDIAPTKITEIGTDTSLLSELEFAKGSSIQDYDIDSKSQMRRRG